MQTVHIALLSAMPEEVGETLNHLENVSERSFGDLIIYTGEYFANQNKVRFLISLAWSGWGKVSSARAATRIISSNKSNFPIDFVLFTGVAGSLCNTLKQWDIIVANEVIQHDMDASPIFEKFTIPSLGKSRIKSKKSLKEKIFSSLFEAQRKGDLFKFGKVTKGLIGTGDKFISNKNDINYLISNIPDIKAVEMEGASVAQVAEQEKIPWVLIRVISDNSDESASQSFEEFLKNYNKYSWLLIENVLSNYLSNFD